jgi:NarL family two-component system response regulator YdfI
MIRVLVIVPSIVVRTGLEALITTDPTISVIGTSASLDTVIQPIEPLQADVILLDWSGQEDESILMSDTSFQAAIVLLVDDLPKGTIAELLRAGVRGVISNEATATEMVGAIAAVAAGLTVLHPDVMETLLPVLPATTRPLPETPIQALTSREVEVLGMLAEGLGNKTIARRLTISEHTVKFHISSIFSKLNASSRTEAVILGARQGLIFI